MSSQMYILKHMQLAMEEKGYEEILHIAAQKEHGVYNEEEPITTNEA
jgi:hypothetical protein